ncbi:unnamed protein product [Ixodes pacificus]
MGSREHDAVIDRRPIGFGRLSNVPYDRQTFSRAWVWPGRAPSGYHLLGGMKTPPWGHHFPVIRRLEASVQLWVRDTPQKVVLAGHGEADTQMVKGARLQGEFVGKVSTRTE